jgi:hypothetical protein
MRDTAGRSADQIEAPIGEVERVRVALKKGEAEKLDERRVGHAVQARKALLFPWSVP